MFDVNLFFKKSCKSLKRIFLKAELNFCQRDGLNLNGLFGLIVQLLGFNDKLVGSIF